MFLATLVASGIAGTVTIGPSCPVERPDQPCADRPYAARIVARRDGRQIAHTFADAHGRFRLRLSPGVYRVTAGPRTRTPIPAAVTVTRRVRTGRFTRTDVVLDSGIRGPVAMPARVAARPRIVSDPIPFPARRRAEMRAYARRHYGLDTAALRRPRVIVEHVTVTSTFAQAFNTFAPDRPDPELHELPGTCAHFVIDRSGTIHQLVSLRLMCRHTVGLNSVAIGIEHVGFTDADVLGDARQLRASLRLTRWLRARFSIARRDVIGHAESLSSPYHRERVARLRRQTHGDMRHANMVRYRRML